MRGYLRNGGSAREDARPPTRTRPAGRASLRAGLDMRGRASPQAAGAAGRASVPASRWCRWEGERPREPLVTTGEERPREP